MPRDVVAGMVPIGIGVGLTFPTLMGAGTSSLPPSSFATGSGVLNMTRQTVARARRGDVRRDRGFAPSPLERLAAFERAWWIMAGLTVAGLAATAPADQAKAANGSRG